MIRRILVALDGADGEDAVIPAARHLVGGTGAVVHLLATRPLPTPAANRSVWAFNPESIVTSTLFGSPGSGDEPPVSFDKVLTREHAIVDRYLARFGSQLAYDGMVVRREIRFGDACAEIIAAARRHAAQLIMLAPHSQGWWDRLRRRGLVQQLIHAAPVPVLVASTAQAGTNWAALRYGRVAV